MSFRDFLAQAAASYGLDLTDEQLSAYDTYFRLLVEWNEKINLTAITEPQEVAVKHIIDSLSCYNEEFFPKGCQLIDVGTGAGFPGLPLKIFDANIRLTLLDSLNKRLTFLQAVIDGLQIQDISLVHARAEEGARNKKYRDYFDVATSRAVARLPVLAELCMPFVKPGGYFIALKGAQYRQEVEEADNAVRVLGGKIVKVRPVCLPGLEDSRAVIYIQKIRHTPELYPRRPGLPEKKPL